jgi:predicted transcriptional regulator
MTTATSKAAFASIKPVRMRDKIYHYISSQRYGATADEIENGLNSTRSSVSARLTELRRDGLIIAVGERPTRSGRAAMVYMVR